MRNLRVPLTSLLLAAALMVVALAQDPAGEPGDNAAPADNTAPVAPAKPALPQGDTGLAAKHPGDVGLDKDADVLLVESFEKGDTSDLATRWSDVKNPGGNALQYIADDVPAGADGSHSLRINATIANDTGGHLYTRLPREVTTMFARFYVKFPTDTSYTHHFVHLGGYHPSTPWPQGGAGERPDGDTRMTTGIEPHGNWGRIEPPGSWGFYSYWHRMNICPDGKYWGNVFAPETTPRIPRGTWQCVELMMKLNTVGKSDGELALWLDGKLVMHFAPGTRVHVHNTGAMITLAPESDREARAFDGFDWRSSDDLKLNFFWLLYYVTPNTFRQNRVANPPATQSVQFDNIVVATRYIGPVRAAPRTAEGRDHDNR